MRTTFVCVAVLSAACQVTPSREVVAVEATASRADVAGATAAGSPAVVVDPVVLALAHAAIAATSHRRRVVLENLANADVFGWKRRTAVLHGHSAFTVAGQTFQVPTVFDAVRDHQQGAIQVTQRALDVAIDGDGFFGVSAPDGNWGYTRCGVLHIDADGKLVTADGLRLLPEITVPNDLLDVGIAPDGQVSCRTAGSPDSTTLLGQLTLSRFVNAPGLRCNGSLLAASEASGSPMTGKPGTAGLGVLKQGCLERSNVQVANELLELQAIERQAQALARALAPYGISMP